MLSYLIKIGFGAIAATICQGMIIALLSRQIRLNFENGRVAGRQAFEFFLLILLKGFTLAYLASILAAAIILPVLLFSSWSVIQSLPGELPYAVTIGLVLMSIGGLVAMPVAFLKKPLFNKRYLQVVMASEPGIYGLIAQLTGQFNMTMVTDIRLTPGADIKVREQVDTFDRVFSGGDRIIEIGLASMEMLNAADMKILLARELSHYADNNDSAMAFIRRLVSRFESLGNNLTDSSFLLLVNPVTWLILLAKPASLLIAEDYLVMNECQADSRVLKFSGTNRLTHALARYNVEIELYRDLLNIIGRSAQAGIGYVGNLYDAMRRAQVESTSDLMVMIDHLFKDAALTKGDVGKRSLRLRLRRLPETPPATLEINRPAIAYLADWRQTENRMLKILGM